MFEILMKTEKPVILCQNIKILLPFWGLSSNHNLQRSEKIDK